MSSCSEDIPRKKLKKQKKKPVRFLITIGLTAVIVCCLGRSLPYLWKVHREKNDYEKLTDQVKQKDHRKKTKDNDFSVDFAELEKINPDICAWIRFDHPDQIPVSYPVLCSRNGYSYLHRDIYRRYSFSGSLFLECGNNRNFYSRKDMSKLIYGHNMNNGTMFGSLKKYRSPDFYQKNRCFTVYTPKAVYRYRIFACFDTTADSFVYQTGMKSDTRKYRSYLHALQRHSLFRTVRCPSDQTPVVVLSTCARHGTDIRFVVCGKLYYNYDN